MTFIPEIWSALIYNTLKNNLVALGICNQNYEGDIREAGDTVHIFSPGTVTTKTYSKNVDMDAPEVPTDAANSLVIDQFKYFNFIVDKIDKVQGKVSLMTSYTSEAAYSMRNAIDAYILGKYTGAGITDTLISPDIDSIFQFFNDMWSTFSTANIPEEGRSATVTPRVKAIINEYLAGKGTPLGDTATVNGLMGKFAQWEIRMSNNVIKTTTYAANDTDQCVFSHISAMTFAFQVPVSDLTLYTPPLRFAEALKGLTIYGHKTVDAARLGAGAMVFV